MPKRKYKKKAQFINENNIKIVINSEPKKRKVRRRRRKPKALMNRVNNLRFKNTLKPILSNIPLSTQIIHQDKLTTDGLKESNIKTTEALKQLTNFMTTNMGRTNNYPQLPSTDTPIIEEKEDMKQSEDEKKQVIHTPTQRDFFTPRRTDSDNEEVDSDIIEAENLWMNILRGSSSRNDFGKVLRSNAKLRKAVYGKAMSDSSKKKSANRDKQIDEILDRVPSRRGKHLRSSRKK
jgi:hypothetical protein